MAESAVAEVVTGTPAGGPEGVPSGGGEPTSGAAPAASGAEPSGQVPQPGAQPSGAESGTAAQPSPSLTEHHVPWGKFREVQTFNTQLRNQLKSFQDNWSEKEGEYSSQIEELNGRVQRLSQVEEDYTALADVLRANPDLAQQLWERAQQAPPTTPLRGAHGQPTTPAHAQLDPTQAKQLSDILGWFQQERTQRAEAQRKAEMEGVSKQLDEQLGNLLKEAEYDKVFLPDARAYVLEEARRMDLGLEHVPYVFSQWLKGIDGKINTHVQRILKGKTQDAGLPMSPGTTPTPITTTPEVGANDEKTNALMLEMLKQRGFTDGG